MQVLCFTLNVMNLKHLLPPACMACGLKVYGWIELHYREQEHFPSTKELSPVWMRHAIQASPAFLD